MHRERGASRNRAHDRTRNDAAYRRRERPAHLELLCVVVLLALRDGAARVSEERRDDRQLHRTRARQETVGLELRIVCDADAPAPITGTSLQPLPERRAAVFAVGGVDPGEGVLRRAGASKHARPDAEVVARSEIRRGTVETAVRDLLDERDERRVERDERKQARLVFEIAAREPQLREPRLRGGLALLGLETREQRLQPGGARLSRGVRVPGLHALVAERTPMPLRRAMARSRSRVRRSHPRSLPFRPPVTSPSGRERRRGTTAVLGRGPRRAPVWRVRA